MNIAEQLSSYAFRLSYADLPREVIHEVKRRTIDSLGCALGAMNAVPAKIVKKIGLQTKDAKGSTLIGTRHQTRPELAAFYNGLLFRYLDYNDTYLSKEPAHPSDNIAPVLAAAETAGRSGKDAIAAAVLAYEIQCRLCDAASIRSRGWDHVTYGAFSTALACAKLFKATSKQMYHALGLAGTANITLRQTRVGELSMWKGCAFANASRNGLFAALLAKEGMTGPAPIFEGKLGFCNLVSGPLELPVLGGRENPFMILSTSIKYYPAEYHAQGAIQAALELRQRIDSPKNIESILVKTFKTSIEIIGGEIEKWNPVSRETADHSLPYCVAVALMDGRVGLAQFSEKRIHDTQLRALVQKVKVEEDFEMTRMYPESVPVKIELRLKNGEILEEQVVYPKGHAGAPLTDAEVEQKFRTLAKGKLSLKTQDGILADVWKFEKIKNIGNFLKKFA